MKRSVRRKVAQSAAAASLIIAAGAVGGHFYFSSSRYGLPYHARFTRDTEDHWIALGGVWEVVDGSMRNDSNDRGAKLLTGSPNWKDYVVEGDVQLLGIGSVGLLARVRDAELGENSQKAYFAGVRTDDGLVLGAYDFAYHEIAKVPLPEPVRPFRWYHLGLSVDGCTIHAYISGAGMHDVKTAAVNDPDCFRSGSIGLRSNGTGGVWRNVKVVPVGVAPAATGRASLPDASPLERALLQIRTPVARTALSVPPQSVISLLSLDPIRPQVASIRGSVVLTRPIVYVQDSMGSAVEVLPETPTPLKIGDEVEVTSEVDLNRAIPVLRKARLRLIREAPPLAPIVLGANQVAEGQFGGMFVQVEGHLRTIVPGKDGTLELRLEAGVHTFQAILPAGRSPSHARDLPIGSRLRLKGVPVTDTRFNTPADPFALLVRSAEDVEVVAGPPWWRTSNLIAGGLALLAFVFICNYLYLLARHWRLRAVADERERLAHEIHDTLAQSFAGIGFQLQAIRNSLPSNSQLLEREVDRAMSMARTSHEEARRSIASLRPESLGPIGLLPALRDCAERMVRSGTVAVETFGEENGPMAPVHVKDALFRIGQEAIANSIRHAEPETIRIRLQQQRSVLYLSVEDDGHGFVVNSDHSGFGLLGMRKRAESIAATLVVKSTPGSGTRVEVKAAAGSRFLGAAWRRSATQKYQGISK